MHVMRHLLFSLAFIFQCEQTPFSIPKNAAIAAPENPKTEASGLVFQSGDGGQTWQDASAGLPAEAKIWRLKTDGEQLTLLAGKDIFHRSASVIVPEWTREFFALRNDIEFSDIYQGRTGQFITCYGKGFFKKMIGTDVLLPMHDGLEDKDVRCVLETADGSLLVGCESGLFRFSATEKTWKKVISDSDNINTLVALDGGQIVAATNRGLLQSTDGGKTWLKTLTEDGQCWNTKRVEGGVLTLTEGGGTYQDGRPDRIRFSTDGGLTWQRIDQNLPKQKRIHSVEKAGNAIFCSLDEGIFRTRDFGLTWELVLERGPKSEDDFSQFNLISVGSSIFVAIVSGC